MYLLFRADQTKATAKPRKRTPSSTRTFPIGERTWTDIEPEDYSPIAYSVSKQLSTLLRHGHQPREEDGAIEFWRLEDYLRNHFVHSQHWSDEMWKSTMAKGGGNKKRIQYCTDPSGQEILFLRALQGAFRTQSHRSFITGQCINSERFLRVHLSHRMCNQFTLRHEFRNDTTRTKFEQKTDGILHICGSYVQGTQRSRCNWLECTASCLEQAKNMEETSKHGVLGRHQTCSKVRI